MCAVWDKEQPVQVQGGGANVGVLVVRRGGGGGVAGGGCCLFVPPQQGQAYYGSPSYCCFS